MKHTLDRLPDYLRRFCVEQNYERYTPREQATWRCIMRQNRDYFKNHAVDVYLDGLKKTGIPIDRIPKISEMDTKLNEFGYGAVGVVGFIPPAIFLEFQSLGIMPIATDIRTLEHIGYTPAPDIVHEAAGHVPVVVDPDYRAYLSLYGEIANRSLISFEDIRRYEAIRLLSDIKENPDTKPEAITAATQALFKATADVSFVSESTKVSRMGWWTIEYGLVGHDPNNLKIYGAGLLSSVSESQNCLDPKIPKHPLTVDCVNVDFDITEPQPQLFVVPTLGDLKYSLRELRDSFSFIRGGRAGVAEAQRCRTVNTIRLDSGIEFAGVVTTFEETSQEPVSFVKLAGPSQICFKEKVLPGHDKSAHQDGFSCPIGRWKHYPERSPATLSSADLSAIGLIKDQEAVLDFCNGFRVRGLIRDLRFAEDRLIMVSWEKASVTKGDKVYFEPDWGMFDMAVGSQVTSVFSGPGDRIAYGEYDIGFASSHPGRLSPFSTEEEEAHRFYKSLRALREEKPSHEILKSSLQELGEKALNSRACKAEWLIYLEILEIAHSGKIEQNTPWLEGCRQRLNDQIRDAEPDMAAMMQRGLAIVTQDA